MKLSEERQIDAPPAAVWQALMDPDVLKECIPGCTELTGSPEDGFEATVTQKVGPVKATFKGQVALTDVVPGESCRLSGEGKGGAAGYARGGAAIRLAPAGAGTLLSYDAEAQVGGKLAQLGSRIIDAFTKRLADQFFNTFKDVVEAQGASGTPDAATPAPQEAAPPAAPETAAANTAAEPEKKGWLKRILG